MAFNCLFLFCFVGWKKQLETGRSISLATDQLRLLAHTSFQFFVGMNLGEP
jgi:hypothetical protein